ncbi:hypothetical protein [Winogradskyella helgolandensis]|uniref:hypothetical protein n=1 Tax=Winogradskyella helgolandensis TaxID=2697010 RepID=UPI0015B83BCC|nr:hypothetical protein [Winogradskyella helgolandensis]
MEPNAKTNSFKKLLNRLQEDSWQLELLISGFAIFGLFYGLEFVAKNMLIAQFENNKVFVKLYIIVHFALQILIFNLILHVLLRGLWIGSLGLRYVFGDIDFEKLNYYELFTTHLKKRIGSFDTYISKLENICSVIFAITFLLVFYSFSFFIITFILIGFNFPIPDWMIIIMRVLFGIFSLGAILTFVDFITQGFLKKKKWIAKLYFPFYLVFSTLTLSFLYRPLIYNLLDNKYGRRINYLLIPFYLLIYVVFHLQYQKSNFITYSTTKIANENIINGRNYEDVIAKYDNIFIGEFAIQSKVISEPYLKIFVPLNNTIEDSLISLNPILKPKKDQRGLYFQSGVSFIQAEDKYDEMTTKFLKAFEKNYSFKIDSTAYKTDFVITNINNQLGFESYIGIQNLSEGKHVIEFRSLNPKNTDSLVSIRKIPFWYFKN